MFWIICVVSGNVQKPFDFEAHKCPLVGFIFWHFHSFRSPSYRKPIEHLSLAIPGFPMSASNSAIARSGHLKIFIHLSSAVLYGENLFLE